MCMGIQNMSSVKVKATVVEDNTGIKSQLPVLLTEQGELSVVTDYLLDMEANGVSASVMNQFIQVVSVELHPEVIHYPPRFASKTDPHF